MSTAVVHDIALEEGGGVKICREMANVLDADLYVGYAAKGVFTEAERLLPQIFRDYSKIRNIYGMFAYPSLNTLRQYDTVIQSGCGVDWYLPRDDQQLIRYVHSPAPGAYDSTGVMAKISRLLRDRTWDYPDKMFVNPRQTLAEVKAICGRQPDILYPPVDVSSFRNEESDGFYLLISRLTEGKGVMSVVDHFSESPERLVVCGAGPLSDKIAQSDVEFRGWVEVEEKHDLFARCEGVIMPSGTESFGIVAAEAFASGKPVYAKRGGALDDIIDPKTGVLYDDISEVKWGQSFDPDYIQSEAQKFDIDIFRERLLDATS